jgi:hypothetical protein
MTLLLKVNPGSDGRLINVKFLLYTDDLAVHFII